MLPDLSFTSDDPATAIGNEQMMYLLLKRLENLNMMDTTVLTALLADGSVNTAKLADLAVTNAKIGDLAVTNAKIGDLAVTNAKIGDLAVQTAKIGDLQVTTLKIAGEGVTTPKRQLLNTQSLTLNVPAGGVVLFRFTVDANNMFTTSAYNNFATTPMSIWINNTSGGELLIFVWNAYTALANVTVVIKYW